MVRCPGQDQRFWKPKDILGVCCPDCGRAVEFFRDEPVLKCPGCGRTVVNSRLDMGCAAWCKYAEQCLGASTIRNIRTIRDIGIIATMKPQAVRPACDGCGCCQQVCREEAITIHEGRAELHEERCVGCGQCVAGCPRQAMDTGPVSMRVLIGGRMGRHPRWAQPLGEADLASAAAVVRMFLDCVAREMRPAERVADVVERRGLERLRHEVPARAV